MTEYEFPAAHRQVEMEDLEQRELNPRRLAVALLGPIAVGKTTVIGKMMELRDGLEHIEDVSKEGIAESIQAGNIPVFESSLRDINELKSDDYDILSGYVYPGPIKQWHDRLEKSGVDVSSVRKSGTRELCIMGIKGFRDTRVDFGVINEDGQSVRAAEDVLRAIENLDKKD